jgi:hypothetical protein
MILTVLRAFAFVEGDLARGFEATKEKTGNHNREILETREHGFLADWFVYLAYFAVKIFPLRSVVPWLFKNPRILFCGQEFCALCAFLWPSEPACFSNSTSLF